MRALVVFWSTPGLASMYHFAIFPSDIRSRGDFFHLLDYVPGIGYSVFYFPGILFFNQSHPWICMYETSNINSTSDTYLVCVIRVYIYKNILHVYIMIKLLIQHYSSVAAYSGYTKCIKTELQYVYCCRMHVRVCTYRYILYHSYFATTNSSSSSSATAASCVCCCLPYAILGIRKNR